MNLFEFQQRINYIVESQQSRNRNPEDIRVCIPIKTPSAIGGTPCIDVESVHLGFDWDNNKLMLYPTKDLSRSDHDYLAKMRTEAAELCWSVYEMGNLKREIKHLNKLLKEKENE